MFIPQSSSRKDVPPLPLYLSPRSSYHFEPSVMALIWLLVSMTLAILILYSVYKLHKLWRARRRGRLALAGLELLPTSMKYHEYRQLPTRSSTPPYFRKPYHSPSLSSNESQSPPILSPPIPSSPSFRASPDSSIRFQSRHQRSFSEPFPRESLPSAWSQEILHPVFSSASGALKPGTHGRQFSQPFNSPFSSPPSTPVSSRSVDVVSVANPFPPLSIGLPIVDDHALIHFSPSIEPLHLDNDNHAHDVEDAVTTSLNREVIELTKSPSTSFQKASPCAIASVMEKDDRAEPCSDIRPDIETGIFSQISIPGPLTPRDGGHQDLEESIIQGFELTLSSKEDIKPLEQPSVKEETEVNLEWSPGISSESDNILPEIPSTTTSQDQDVELPVSYSTIFLNGKTDMSTTEDVVLPELPSTRTEDRGFNLPAFQSTVFLNVERDAIEGATLPDPPSTRKEDWDLDLQASYSTILDATEDATLPELLSTRKEDQGLDLQASHLTISLNVEIDAEDATVPDFPSIRKEDRDRDRDLDLPASYSTDMSMTEDVLPDLVSIRNEDLNLGLPEVAAILESAAKSGNSLKNDIPPAPPSSVRDRGVDIAESGQIIFQNADIGISATEDVLIAPAEFSPAVVGVKDDVDSPVIDSSEQSWNMHEPSTKQTFASDVEGLHLGTWQEESRDLLPPNEGILPAAIDPSNEDAALPSSSQDSMAHESLPSPSPVLQNIQISHSGLGMQSQNEVAAAGENGDVNQHGNSNDIDDGDEKRNTSPSDLISPANGDDSESATPSYSVRPAWSLRAADAPPLGISAQSKELQDDRESSAISLPVVKRTPSLPGTFPESSGVSTAVETIKSNNSSSSASRRRVIRSPIDIALAMQLRPGLGLGADPAWMVRFLMSMFGWFIVLLSGTGGYDGYRPFHRP